MIRPRFSIAGLLGAVVFAAIAMAALRAASDLWDTALFTATLACLLTAVLLAVHRAENRRAFWLGFALFGWTYLAASLVPSIESSLLTAKALGWLDPHVAGRPTMVLIDGSRSILRNTQQVAFSPDGKTLRGTGQALIWQTTALAGAPGTSENFLRIGHSLCALVLAFLGGWVSKLLYKARATPE